MTIEEITDSLVNTHRVLIGIEATRSLRASLDAEKLAQVEKISPMWSEEECAARVATARETLDAIANAKLPPAYRPSWTQLDALVRSLA